MSELEIRLLGVGERRAITATNFPGIAIVMGMSTYTVYFSTEIWSENGYLKSLSREVTNVIRSYYTCDPMFNLDSFVKDHLTQNGIRSDGDQTLHFSAPKEPDHIKTFPAIERDAA